MPWDDEPAYLLRWEEALGRENIDLAELKYLGPAQLAEFLADHVRRDKREAVNYGGLIVLHLLCLKYASELDFQNLWKRWRDEVISHPVLYCTHHTSAK